MSHQKKVLVVLTVFAATTLALFMGPTKMIDRLLGFLRGSTSTWEHRMSQAQSSNPLKDLAQVAIEVVKLLPDGSKIVAADFAQTFGVDTLQLLQWLQVSEIRRSGNRVTAERTHQSTQSIYNVQLILDKTVAFDVVQGTMSVELKDVEGVQVDPGKGLGVLDLKEASVSKDSNGVSVIAVKLEIASFLPYLPITVRLAPDGQLLPD
ncbi:MAG: hypothetical protein HY711_00255 [Candidatus Melainabacteria bacterium]|nr:hypothetical protein [Candidatus Melainabacteria bacterium]